MSPGSTAYGIRALPHAMSLVTCAPRALVGGVACAAGGAERPGLVPRVPGCAGVGPVAAWPRSWHTSLPTRSAVAPAGRPPRVRNRVKYFVPVDDFTTPATRKGVDTYREYRRPTMQLLRARNRRIGEWALITQPTLEHQAPRLPSQSMTAPRGSPRLCPAERGRRCRRFRAYAGKRASGQDAPAAWLGRLGHQSALAKGGHNAGFAVSCYCCRPSA